MRLLALSGDAVASESDDEPDDGLVLLHEEGVDLHADAVLDIAEIMMHDASLDVVTAAWTFESAEFGVVRRRGVLSPERVRWTNSLGPAVAVRSRTLKATGWGTDGHHSLSDAALRLSELDASRGLRLKCADSTAAHVDTPEEGQAARAELHAEAVKRHLARLGISADVAPLPATDGMPVVSVRRRPCHIPTVALLVPATGWITEIRGTEGRLVINMLESVTRVTEFPHDRMEIVVVGGPEADPDLQQIVAQFDRDRLNDVSFRFVETATPFSHSHRTNLAAANTNAEILVFLNDDTEAVSPDWLTQITAVACEPGVGLVGPVMRYPDMQLQSGGHVHPPTNISPRHKLVAPSQAELMRLGRDVTGVTLACAALRADHFRAVGGLSARIHNAFNDVDLAMKLKRRGLRHVSLGCVEMTHLETVSRAPGAQEFEQRVLLDRWGRDMETERLHFVDEVVNS